MIQDQSESNSERRKDKNFYLSEEAGLTPLLAMTRSFEDCDWLVVQEEDKRVLLRVGYKLSLRNYRCNFSCFTVNYRVTLSHTHYICSYIYSLFFIYHAVIFNIFYRKWTGSESAVIVCDHFAYRRLWQTQIITVAFFQLPNMLM